MAKEDNIMIEGIVKTHSHNTYIVEVEIGEDDDKVKKEIKCKIGGKLRMNYIRVLPGDHVTVQVSPYDTNVGTIVYRTK